MSGVSTTDEVTAGALPAPVLELLDAAVPPERAETLRAFALASTRRLPPQDLAERRPAELVGVIVGAFGSPTPGDRTSSRSGCSNRPWTEHKYEALGTVVEIGAAHFPRPGHLFSRVLRQLFP